VLEEAGRQRMGSEELGEDAKKTLDCFRQKVSGCRTARVAILWGQSGANKRSPSALNALKVPGNAS
jgi:hypothetical protein